MDVLMPQLGETVAEGKITKWFKAAGDKVVPGDNLFEIETDKVSMEVPATEPGVLTEVRVAAGEIAPVGAVVAVISASGAAVKPAPAKPATPPPVATPPARAPATAAPTAQAASAPTPHRPVALDPFHEVRTPERNYGPAKLASGVAVSPLARRLAAEAGIDLSRITASGPHGRILAKDVTGRERCQCRGAGDRDGRLGRQGEGALRARLLRGGAARRHAADDRGAADRGQADPFRISISPPTSPSSA